jgi:hypothetical protein
VGEEIWVPSGSRWQAWHVLPEFKWMSGGSYQVWLSRVYIVQVARKDYEPWIRLSIRRIDEKPIREDWDELQRIKNEIAGEGARCVELYPRHDEVVNVANMRHLFVVPEDFPIPCLWTKGRGA